jgi:hypothetical protein
MSDCIGCGGPADFDIYVKVKPLTDLGSSYIGTEIEGETQSCCVECIMKIRVAFEQLKDNPVCEEPRH